MKKRMFSLLLVMVMVFAMLPWMGFTAEAATKKEPKRVIGIVFDDSGSMYGGGNYSWCRATYAVEVFAAMMNDGDQLQIYPMNGVVLDDASTTYTMQNPLIINGPQESAVVRQMVGMQGGNGTPIETIDWAYEGLKNTQADEKYLIVLTDGGYFHSRSGYEMRKDETEKELTETLGMYSADMNVMYLGIGTSVAVPTVTDPSRQLFLEASDTAQTLNQLTKMCNTIFGRNELGGVKDSITVDVTLSKLIVFVQGPDVGGVSVSGGSEIRSTDTHYPDPLFPMGAIDTSLQGTLVTYGAFDAGTYNLSYTGDATSINVYYEPDVDMYVRLLDPSGNEVTASSNNLYSGTYYLEYGMVDRDGNPTTSSLLGETKYELTYYINGQAYTETANQAGKLPLDLKADDVLDGKFKVTYLSDYTIEVGGLPCGEIKIEPMPLEELILTVSGGSDTYALTDLENQAIYDVQLSYGGRQLTGEELKRVVPNVQLTGGNAELDYEMTDSGIHITIGYNGGEPLNTECGDYQLSIGADYTNQDNQKVSATPVLKEFTIEDDSSSVSAKFQMETDYYLTTEIGKAEPIKLVLTVGGVPLTPEQFNQVVVESLDTGNLACDVTADPANSCYLIKMRAGEVENGRYKLSCKLQIPNEIGRLEDAKADTAFQVQPYPEWLPWVIAGLISLGLFALIWAFLNTKILPKKITVGKCTFNVDGSNVSGSASCVYVGGGKKRGTLEINSPRYAANPSAFCGFKLELEADTPRRIKSSARSAKVRNVTALNPSTTYLKTGPFKMVQDPVTEKLVRAVGKADAPIDFSIKNNTSCTVTASVLDVTTGGETAVNLTVNLKFF